MQVLLNAEPQIADHSGLRSYLATLAYDALGRFGGRVVRVDAHLSDENGAAKGGTDDDIHCTLEAQVAGLDLIIAKDRAATPRHAIHDAVGTLERAIAHALGKREARRSKAVV